MSAERVPSHEHHEHPPVSSPEPTSTHHEAHVVPPTPEPPHEDIENVKKSLTAAAPTPKPAAPNDSKPKKATLHATTDGHSASHGHHVERYPEKVARNGLALFGFVVVHLIWESFKWVQKNADGIFSSKGGGGGGGHGGGHDDHGHGGGHH